MHFFSLEILALSCYLIFLFSIALLGYKKNQNSSDFIIGGRKMHFIVTALAAHASDMSSWLFLAYPAQIYLGGLQNSWLALGLIAFMFLNWKFVAPTLRKETAKFESLTLFSYFESAAKDTSGMTRLLTAMISFFFYSIYISAGIMGLGLLLESLLGLPYFAAILFGISIVIPFLLLGGFITLAWTDLAQGLFLLAVILLVPILGWLQLPQETSFEAIQADFAHFLPNSPLSWTAAILLLVSWGLGYFGQPHILTKFMGIDDPKQIPKSMLVGMSWQTITLVAATSIGLIGSLLFPKLANPELLFIEMSRLTLNPFFLGFVLSAIIGVTITATGAQILVVVSTIAEDFYKKLFFKEATNAQVVRISRYSTLLVAGIAVAIAAFKPTSLFELVSYAWFGLGASFGPLVIACLIKKQLHRYSAWAGIVIGGFVSGTFPAVNLLLPMPIPPLIPGFLLSLASIFLVNHFCRDTLND
ncbi:MAG: sodium/proline symporter [Chlamydiia bacterium]